MAEQGAVTNTQEVRTEGKAAGPITFNQMYVGMLAIVLVFIAGSLGLVIPAEVATAVSTFVLIGIAWWTRGRKTIETKTVFEQSSIGTPVGYESTPAYDQGVTPSLDVIPDGTGAHRAEPTNYSGE